MADPIREGGPWRVASGETDIDISAAVYTGYIALLTITPAAGGPLEDAWLDLDLSKAVTGFSIVHTAETIQFQVQRKIDGTNWKPDLNATTAALSGTNAAGLAQRFHFGPVDPTAAVRLVVKLSAEVGDTEFPYRLQYLGPTPTITVVAA